ncbi:hypothetical protein [Marinilactibacillus kalidii]|uniref:hypothetical protein n=1 Tax=Marinilactibacillus kalidii TaxID=2820274 RepID=UPI001ABDC3AF|nr:hypothetical protein [Marinilactibacillus kalidii]
MRKEFLFKLLFSLLVIGGYIFSYATGSIGLQAVNLNGLIVIIFLVLLVYEEVKERKMDIKKRNQLERWMDGLFILITASVAVEIILSLIFVGFG